MKEKLDIPDISILFDDNYNWRQKNEILNGLAHGVDITQYCDETFDDKQMSCIRQGLINGVDVTLYKGLVIEFKIENKEGRKLLVDQSNRPTIYENISIIDKDESFHSIEYYDEGTVVYGINPATFNSLNCVCFYSYNPYLE